MNAKHYVSLEAAKKLKELGYNLDCEYAYNEINLQVERMGANANDISDYCSAPTLLEAMDWLEEKGVWISIEAVNDDLWESYIYSRELLDDNYENVNWYTNRLACMHAAIEKALELL